MKLKHYCLLMKLDKFQKKATASVNVAKASSTNSSSAKISLQINIAQNSQYLNFVFPAQSFGGRGNHNCDHGMLSVCFHHLSLICAVFPNSIFVSLL